MDAVTGWWQRLRDVLGSGRRDRDSRSASPKLGRDASAVARSEQPSLASFPRRSARGDGVQALIGGLLNHGDPNVRAGAARKLGDMAPHAAELAVEALTQALRDDDAGVRSSAALSLADFSADAVHAVDALIEALGDDDDDVRSSAGIALQEIGGDALPALERALTHDNPLVRFEAKMVLRWKQVSGASAEIVPTHGATDATAGPGDNER